MISMAFHGGAYSYDVFVSYTRQDSRNFIGFLINSLRQKGLNVFKDDEFERGRSISPELVAAIEGAKAAIVVFSENYAKSTWCLDELAKILECREQRRHLVWPIFYKVDPSNVRNQRSSYGKAMDAHKARFRDNLTKVDCWSKALTDASNLGGWTFNKEESKDKSQFIQKICEEVSRQLATRASLYVAKHPVGLESRVAELSSLLNDGSRDDVRVVAMYGPEGVGKTTIAKAVYNSMAHQFEGSSFLRDISKHSSLDLNRLQNTLLSEILRETNLSVGNVDKGISIIQERLCTKRVLLVLDDLNYLNQLQSLAGEPIQFGKGSRILVTTRNQHLINYLEIPSASIYEVKKLNFQEALKLLCSYAFKGKVAPNSYAEVAKCVVGYSQGVPLELVELGHRLYGKSVGEWTSELENYASHCRSKDKGKEILLEESPRENEIKESLTEESSMESEILGVKAFHVDLDNGQSTSDETRGALLSRTKGSLSFNESLHAKHLALQPYDSHPGHVTFEMQEGIYVEVGEGSKTSKQDKWKGLRSSMIRAKGHSVVHGTEPIFWRSLPESRVFEDAELNYVYSLDIKGKMDSNMSEKTAYGAYLIFKFITPQHDYETKPIDLSVKLEGNEDSNDDSEFLVRLSKVQGDGWMEIEIGEFFNDSVEDDSMMCTNIEIDSNVTKAGLVVQGIEIRPKQKMGSQTDTTSLTSLDEFRSLSLGSPTSVSTDVTSDRFPFTNYPEVDMDSDSPLSSIFNLTSKKEEFSHLFDHTKLIDNGNLRIAEDKSSGKICCMVSARGLTISWSDRPTYWSWTSIPQSRFPVVAKLHMVYYFNIEAAIEAQCLSPRTTYAAYFLFKFEMLVSGFREQPLNLVVHIEGKALQERRVFLDPLESGLRPCQRREDGWMELSIGEFFINGDENGMIRCSLKEHTTSVRKTGLIVEGIEFRPKES